jgi:hypothetical protein
MRELTIRGVDGPGLNILDVLPRSYEAAPGGLEAIAARKALVDKMLSKPPKMFVSRPENAEMDASGKVKVEGLGQEESEVPNVTLQDLKSSTVITISRIKVSLLGRERSDELDTGSVASSNSALGWTSHCTVIPRVQEMSREMPRIQSLPLPVLQSIIGDETAGIELNEDERRDTLERSWSVAY